MEDDFIGCIAKQAGWGVENHKYDKPSNDLLYIETPIIDGEYCKKQYKQFNDEQHICVSTSTGETICYGDSGSALAISNDDDEPILIGIGSFASKLCMKKFPTVHTRITNQMEWIKSVMES